MTQLPADWRVAEVTEAPCDDGLRWPRPRRSFGPVCAHATSNVVPAMLSVTSTHTEPKSSAIIAATGEICGLASFIAPVRCASKAALTGGFATFSDREPVSITVPGRVRQFVAHETTEVREVPHCRRIRGHYGDGLAHGHAPHLVAQDHERFGTLEPNRVDCVVRRVHRPRPVFPSDFVARDGAG